MKGKNFNTIIITLLVSAILLVSLFAKKTYAKVNTNYQVFLNGERIGVIGNKNDLYALIDYNQTAIKEKYKVENVYPPNNLKIVETDTYSNKLDEVKNVYDKIEQADDFAIKGYTITIKSDEKSYQIKVLDKEIFYNAAKRFVSAFLNQDEYNKYISNTQSEIVETGRIIENMQFKENITIKESYISVNDKIYTSEQELTQFLLFGENPDTKSYTIALGDTIESISEANKLNVEEFLIANAKYKSENTILKVGDSVNVTLISPQLTYVYKLKEVYDQTIIYGKERVADNTKYTTYSEITTPGINGLNRVQEEYEVENGERSQAANPIILATLRPVQNQVTTYGTKRPYNPGGPSNWENPVVTAGDWFWPTNAGYVITSRYGWRWGSMHYGLDISGAGNFGSPIYAAADGVVELAFNGCPSSGKGKYDTCGYAGRTLGNQITINHGNGYVTIYGHLHQTINVRVGQTVKRGDRIGSMGHSGKSTGAHLHFEVKYNGVNLNPLSIYS